MPRFIIYDGTKMSINERLIAAFHYLRRNKIVSSQKKVAEAMNIDAQEVSMAFRGLTGVITPEFVRDFNEAFNGTFNFEWLMFGTGDMLSGEKQDKPVTARRKKENVETTAMCEAYTERLNKAWDYLHAMGIETFKKNVAKKIGCSQPNFSHALHGNPNIITRSFMHRFAMAYSSIFNIEWVLNGTGDMLIAGSCIPSARVVSVRKVTGDVIWAPIIPHSLMRKPNCDVIETISKGGYKLEYLCSGNIDVDLWVRMDSSALYPEIVQGDYIGVKASIERDMSIIPGEIYAINTRSKGIIVRKLGHAGNGMLAAYTADERKKLHPDFMIESSDVIKIFRRVMIIRF